MKKVIEKLDVMYLNEKEQEYYEAEQKDIRDRAEALRTAIEMGKEEGVKVNALETARKMKSDGLPIDMILKYTGLTPGVIEEL